MLAMGRNRSPQQSAAKTGSQTLRRPRLERQSHGFSPMSSGRHTAPWVPATASACPAPRCIASTIPAPPWDAWSGSPHPRFI